MQCAWIAWPLKMESISCSEPSVTNYNLRPHQIPEERRSQCCLSCRYRGVANKMKSCIDLTWEFGRRRVVFLELLSRLLSLDLEVLRNIWEQISNTVAEIRTVCLLTLVYLMLGSWACTISCQDSWRCEIWNSYGYADEDASAVGKDVV
jgi:hypothetical protein